MWNPALSLPLPVKEFEFSDPEIVRIRAAVELWDSYGAGTDASLTALFPGLAGE